MGLIAGTTHLIQPQCEYDKMTTGVNPGRFLPLTAGEAASVSKTFMWALK